MGALMKAPIEVTTLDYHTAGEPLRIVTGGLPPVPGADMAEKRRYMMQHLDDYRRLIMLEPRGHADMYGAVITEPVSPRADCGVLFVHNEGCSTMCGHGIIALATAAVEKGVFTYRDPGAIRIDTPAGLVTARVESGAEGTRVAFLNVPAFVLEDALEIQWRGQAHRVTIAFGGAYYAYLDATRAGLTLDPRNADAVIAAGREIKTAVSEAYRIRHPGPEADMDFLYGVIFVSELPRPGHSRNACVFADGELDRSPTGTGVSGRAAIELARGDINLDDTLVIQSILGTEFTVRCVENTTTGGLPAVMTEVGGRAHMTGEHRFVLTENDPLPHGFLIR